MRRGSKWTYSNGDYDRVGLALFSATSLMVGSAWETDGRGTQKLREKSEKKEVEGF